jgi:hypothetical protein
MQYNPQNIVPRLFSQLQNNLQIKKSTLQNIIVQILIWENPTDEDKAAQKEIVYFAVKNKLLDKVLLNSILMTQNHSVKETLCEAITMFGSSSLNENLWQYYMYYNAQRILTQNNITTL